MGCYTSRGNRLNVLLAVDLLQSRVLDNQSVLRADLIHLKDQGVSMDGARSSLRWVVKPRGLGLRLGSLPFLVVFAAVGG